MSYFSSPVVIKFPVAVPPISFTIASIIFSLVVSIPSAKLSINIPCFAISAFSCISSMPVFFAASFAFVIIPFSPVKVAMVTPANISNTIIVIISAISVIAFSFVLYILNFFCICFTSIFYIVLFLLIKLLYCIIFCLFL